MKHSLQNIYGNVAIVLQDDHEVIALVADIVAQRDERGLDQLVELGLDGAHLDARRGVEPPPERPSLELDVGRRLVAVAVGVDRLHEVLDELRGRKRPAEAQRLLSCQRPHVQDLLGHWIHLSFRRHHLC